MVGGQQYGFVAGNVGLGRQHIKTLRTRGARGGFQREGSDAMLGQFGNGFIAERVKHANQHGGAVDQGQFAVVRGNYFKDQLGAKGVCGTANSCACGFIGAVESRWH
jgi:hypothetical protein